MFHKMKVRLKPANVTELRKSCRSYQDSQFLYKVGSDLGTFLVPSLDGHFEALLIVTSLMSILRKKYFGIFVFIMCVVWCR